MKIGIGEALEYSALGIGIVFAVIIVLMIIVAIMTFVLRSTKTKASVSEEAQTAEPARENSVQKRVAPGSAGDVKLYNVSDRDAAMIMAIVADKMQKPLNELHFISIKMISE